LESLEGRLFRPGVAGRILVEVVGEPLEANLAMDSSRIIPMVTLSLWLVSSPAAAATAAVNWTAPHQQIDGFGAADAQTGASMSAAHQQFFFGTGDGQLGLSLLRAGVTNDSGDPGNCSTVNMGCAGVYVSDMQAIIAKGGRVYASPWSPPAIYKTNMLSTCTAGAGLAVASYGLYATWLANFVKSLKMYSSIDLYAMSLQNEPNVCQDYDSAIWSAAEIDNFVKDSLGPAFSSAGLSTLLFVPEGGGYGAMNLGSTCGGDSACNMYVGGINWHDYDSNVTNLDTVNSTPYPSAWPAGKKFWETEASCGPGFGPNFCQSGFNTNITDALGWAAVIDDRLAVENASAWLYWWLIDNNSTDDQGLIASDGTIPKRAYTLGQYSRFVRPGYSRIDATHSPQTGVSVSAYQDKSAGKLVIVATNYNTASVSQDFSIANGPAFTTLTPWVTSASLSLAQQTSVSVSAASFSYMLAAESITTLVGSSAPGGTDAGGTDAGNADAGGTHAGDASSSSGSDAGVMKDAETRADANGREAGTHTGGGWRNGPIRRNHGRARWRSRGRTSYRVQRRVRMCSRGTGAGRAFGACGLRVSRVSSTATTSGDKGGPWRRNSVFATGAT
jgi:glucuronoarabinoxylan endo-1,4-beta-xylanase